MAALPPIKRTTSGMPGTHPMTENEHKVCPKSGHQGGSQDAHRRRLRALSDALLIASSNLARSATPSWMLFMPPRRDRE